MIRNSRQVLKLVISVGFVTGIAGAGVWFLNSGTAGTPNSQCGARVQNYSYQVPWGNAVWNQTVCDLPEYALSDEYVRRFFRWSTFNDGSPGSESVHGKVRAGPPFPKPALFDPDGNANMFSRHIYYASDATTEKKVFTTAYVSNLDEADPSIYDDKSFAPDTPIPWNPSWKTGRGGDNEIVILDDRPGPTEGRIYDLSGFWPEGDVKETPDCRLKRVLFPGRLCTYRTSIGRDIEGNVVDYRTFEGYTDGRGVGLSMFATFTMPEEIKAGEIRHALGLGIPNTAVGPICTEEQLGTSAEGFTCGTAVAPATKVEWGGFLGGHARLAPDDFKAIYTQDKLIPEGMRFAMDADDNYINQWIQSRPDLVNDPVRANTARIFARAIIDYGFMPVDTNGNGPKVQVAGVLNPKHKQLWAELGIENDNDSRTLLDGFLSEDKLYVVDPPTLTCEDGRKTKYYCIWTEASYDNSTPPPADTTKPTVSISEPTNNSTVSGTVDISASASDNVAVARVEFYLDGNLESTSSTSPYRYNLVTTNLSDGIHTVEARAYDTTGNENATSITITVNNQAAPDFPADFNKDGTVSIKDLAILLSGYGNDVTEYTNGDCNGDGQVTLQDLAILLSEYGRMK